MGTPWLIAVHGGAGFHSTDPASEHTVKHALRSACTSALQELRRNGRSSKSAVEHAICALEDCECLNAGYGSNLSIDGNVECDASIMDGLTHSFGSSGAVQGIKNPIALARAIMQNSTNPQALGRVPPLTLVGPGAHAFAASSGLQLVAPAALISKNARREWQKWKDRLESATASGSEAPNSQGPQALTNVTASEAECSVLEDTVGAIACDTDGGMAAGVSSGGILLKYPGRIGEAAVFGAGVWAHSPPGARTGIACSVSGTGEAIIRAAFARTLAEALCIASPEDTHDILRLRLEAFSSENYVDGEDEPSVGVLVMTKEPIEFDTDSGSDTNSDLDVDVSSSERPANSPASNSSGTKHKHAERDESQTQPQRSRSETAKLRLWCAFTTKSMAIAYASSEYEKPRAFIMRQRNRQIAAAKRSVCIAALPLSR